MRRILPAIFFVALTVLSCRRPSGEEHFVRGDGPYTFEIDFGDSLAVYDIDFYTVVDSPDGPAETPLLVRWSKDTVVFTERVFLPLEGEGRYSREIRAPYRHGVTMADPGTWHIDVSVEDSVPGLRGMGIAVRRDGSR